MPDSIESSSPTKTYTPLMATGILLFTLIFSGAAALSAVKVLLDLTIRFAPNIPVQFKTKVNDTFVTHSRRGGFNGTEYSFNNPPVNSSTLFCDRDYDAVLTGVKVGDTIVIKEKVSFAGAYFLSAERVSS